MNSLQLKTLLNNFIQLREEQDSWISKIPSEINSVFFDNPYTASQSMQIDLLLKFAFGPIYEDVSYFLYEPSPHHIISQQKEYIINNVDEYIQYLIEEKLIGE